MSHAVYVFDCLDEPDAFMCNTIMRSYVIPMTRVVLWGFTMEEWLGNGFRLIIILFHFW
jgi:hypothetical protein